MVTREDGRLPLTVYMLPETIEDLKDASKEDKQRRYAYEIVEEAVMEWLKKHRPKQKRASR